jgi:hypothetical protein
MPAALRTVGECGAKAKGRGTDASSTHMLITCDTEATRRWVSAAARWPCSARCKSMVATAETRPGVADGDAV